MSEKDYWGKEHSGIEHVVTDERKDEVYENTN